VAVISSSLEDLEKPADLFIALDNFIVVKYSPAHDMRHRGTISTLDLGTHGHYL